MTTSTFDHDLRLTRGPDRVRPAQSRTSGGEDRRESDLARSRPVLTAMAVATRRPSGGAGQAVCKECGRSRWVQAAG